MHIKASRPKAITMELELKLLRQANVVASGNQLIYTGNAEFENMVKEEYILKDVLLYK